MGGSILTIKDNAESLVVASKETGLEVNADKTEYMVMSRDQNAGQNGSKNFENILPERVDDFKYLGTTQHCLGDKIEKNEMGGACRANVREEWCIQV